MSKASARLREELSIPGVGRILALTIMIAHNALAHKLARAAYYIMRDGVMFMPDKTSI